MYQGRCSAQCKECDKHEEGEESESHVARSIATVRVVTGKGSRCIIEWERDCRRFGSREHGGLRRLRQKSIMWSMRALPILYVDVSDDDDMMAGDIPLNFYKGL